MARKVPERAGEAVACNTEQTQLGEGIRWDGRRSELLAVDILAGRVARGLLRNDGLIERVGVYQLPETVGMIAPIQGDDGWVLGAGRGFVHLALDGTQRTIAQVAPAGTRMNDGACDPQGRFWGGTLADDHHTGGGALYRLDRTGRTEVVLEGSSPSPLPPPPPAAAAAPIEHAHRASPRRLSCSGRQPDRAPARAGQAPRFRSTARGSRPRAPAHACWRRSGRTTSTTVCRLLSRRATGRRSKRTSRRSKRSKRVTVWWILADAC